MINRRTLLGAATTSPFVASARAQAAYPSRPITVVVPYPPGGSVDIVARALSEPMAQLLHQPVIVENRGGGSGVVATQSVATADPDGYRIELGTQQTHGTNEALLPNIGYRAVENFTPICEICTLPHALVVKRDLPAANAAELVALLKREPGRYNYGSTGNGSSSHLAGELFKIRAGVAAQHVPYRGGALLAQDLLAGVVDFGFVVIANILGQIQSGGVRALAIASSARAPILPDVPTMTEAGIADVDADAWFAYFAPANTPSDRIAILAQAVETALGQEAVRASLARNAVVLRWRPPSEMPAFIAAEVRKWAEVVKLSGAKADL
ncbi:MAG: Bug family tripartite tricarboxylate transporter substrate binding protein [Xanthobacteraceae bacterium]